jgi:hypothetical protein
MEMKYGLVKFLSISATWTCLPLDEPVALLLAPALATGPVPLLDELLPELQAAMASPATTPSTASLANFGRDLSPVRTTM